MARTSARCPRCRQPMMADVEQLFDLNSDPKAKQRFLSGNFNVVHCQNCGYEGSLATPLVYHDPDKELLLTYFPPELGLPVNEQEKMIGPMINQALNRLPPEKRKAYLLRPLTMLTQQQMIERVLEADGITKEMLQAQQQRLNLLQRLLSTPPEGRAEIIKQEENLIDESFFSMLSRLIEASMAQSDQQSGRALADLQKELLSQTKVGQSLAAQAAEAEEAVKSLQEASQKGLTREALLDLIINASSEIRLTTLVSLTRSGLDYNFFQILSERIDTAEGQEKERLTELREKLLEMVQEIDQAMQKQVAQARQDLEGLLKARDIPAAVQENTDMFNDIFIDTLKVELQAARQKNDTERLNKLQQVVDIIQKLSVPPGEIALVQDLIGATSDEGRQKILEENADKVTPEFLQLMSSLATQGEGQSQSADVVKTFQDAYMAALRFSMEANLKK
ncbi:MAG: CpXC domain-containing protein [Anaerolineaceae bacterium]